ncbi:hypothetical protein TSAR_009092 [Trichomalopsis sarcophagae]|uniref:Uncharacterized protein n=1 Tax=Trichomalopsis sarcophagae TaxID=543379 RepID=A0A232FFU0_9HYME|nr:hypothetical protein TSAR_009092 [Trichomalopsis sarcophagae]
MVVFVHTGAEDGRGRAVRDVAQTDRRRHEEEPGQPEGETREEQVWHENHTSGAFKSKLVEGVNAPNHFSHRRAYRTMPSSPSRCLEVFRRKSHESGPPSAFCGDCLLSVEASIDIIDELSRLCTCVCDVHFVDQGRKKIVMGWQIFTARWNEFWMGVFSSIQGWYTGRKQLLLPEILGLVRMYAAAGYSEYADKGMAQGWIPRCTRIEPEGLETLAS